MNKMKKGFTLVEIMIVVAIIAILAAIAIPNFIAYRKESQENACASSMSSIKTAAETWLSKPANADKTPTLALIAPTDGSGYLKEVPKCPAGGTYELTLDDNGAVKVTCDKHTESSSDSGSTGGTTTP